MSGPFRGRSTLYLGARATLTAVAQILEDADAYLLEHIAEVPLEIGNVVVAILRTEGDQAQRFVGAARGSDVCDAAAKAVLDALNRHISRGRVPKRHSSEKEPVGVDGPYARLREDARTHGAQVEMILSGGGGMGLKELAHKLAGLIWEREQVAQSVETTILSYVLDAVTVEVEYRRRMRDLDRRLTEIEGGKDSGMSA